MPTIDLNLGLDRPTAGNDHSRSGFVCAAVGSGIATAVVPDTAQRPRRWTR